MRVLVATDAHIFKTPDGKHWTPAIYDYTFWKRYLNIFKKVRIVARTKQIDELPKNVLAVDGPGVEVFPVPFYQGPKGLLKNYFQIHMSLKGVAEECDVAIFRMPSQTASMVLAHVKKIPIGGEIVYDPTDDLERRDVSLIIKCLDRITSNKLKKFCMRANGVSYVTEKTIQKHYPSYARIYGETRDHFETYYSTIVLERDAFTHARDFTNKKDLSLVFSNVSMNSERKGEPVFLKTVCECRRKGYDVSGVIIGDGNKKEEFEQLAKELGILEHIKFTGRFNQSSKVRECMSESDLFLFPTQAEGLPRSILEAMAIGLPVLSTPVGGIPEIIEEKYLFNPLDYKGFSNMVCYLYDHREELRKVSLRNFDKALEFRNDILQKRRDSFYSKLVEIKE